MIRLSVGETLAGWFYDLCELVSSFLSWLIGLLPESSLNVYESVPESVRQYLGWVNWFLPIHEITLMLAGWVAALLITYLVIIAMKFFKILGGSG